MDKKNTASVTNIYELNGKVPFATAVPFGLQHVLAMFVSNLAPIAIILAAAQPAITAAQTGALLQNAMFVAGIASMIQIYPILRKVGSGLPVVMGVSFTFVSVLSVIAATFGYSSAIGACLVGGICEGILGLFAKYWKRLITPIVAASVVTAIGFSLFTVGARSFGGGYTDDFGSAKNLIIATITLVTCILWNIFAKGHRKQLSVLAGLVVGYVIAAFAGMVDFSSILSGGIISFPKFLMFKPEFHPGAIFSVCVIFLVSATETIGDTSALTNVGLHRGPTEEEISGSIAIDGFGSAFASIMGVPPVTSFSQNVGLVGMTGVVNRFTIATGAGLMILGGMIPPIGNFFASLPQCVLGGCTIMMFGNILMAGMQMIFEAGTNQRNITIVSLSLSVGIGFTASTESAIWSIFPELVQQVFAANVVAVVFVLALILDLVLPKDMEIKRIGENGKYEK